MIGFRGISAPGPASPRHDDDGHLAPTKEAQEATNLGLYERALRAQRAGRDAHAAATYKELLAQPMLADVAPEGAWAGSADSAPLLKYLCYKNLATLASQAQDWTACVRFFSNAVSIDASDVVVWYKMGAAAYAGEHLSVARYALEHGLRVDPTHWLTTKLLIQVLVAMGNEVAGAALIEHARAVDPGYASRARHAPAACADVRDAKRQRTAGPSDDMPAGGPDRIRLVLPGPDPSWAWLVQELVELATRSVQHAQTVGFRAALEFTQTNCTGLSEGDGAAEQKPCRAPGGGDPESARDDMSPMPQDGARGRKSERTKRPHRVGQRSGARPPSNDADCLSALEPASLRLMRFIREGCLESSARAQSPGSKDDAFGVASPTCAGNVHASPGADTPAAAAEQGPRKKRRASTPVESHVTGNVPLSCSDFIRQINSHAGRTLTSVIRDVLISLCSDVQRTLPKQLLPLLLQLHRTLRLHSAVALCWSCSMFIAELHFSAARHACSAQQRSRELQHCCDLMGTIGVGGDPGVRGLLPELQIRLSWLQGLVAEQHRPDPSAAKASFVYCAAWLQRTAGARVCVANSEHDNVISESSVAQKLSLLDRAAALQACSYLYRAGDYAAYVTEATKLLRREKARLDGQQWRLLLQRLLVASERAHAWTALFLCHEHRLIHVLRGQPDSAFEDSSRGSTIADAPERGVQNELLRLLSSLRTCGALSGHDWCPNKNANSLMSLVAQAIEVLENAAAPDELHEATLTAWECFARLWANANARASSIAAITTATSQWNSLASIIKDSCSLDAHGVQTGPCHSLVRYLAVELLKLQFARASCTSDEIVSCDATDAPRASGHTADDSAEVNAVSEAWLDWSLLSLHHIQFSEAPQQQHRQKKHSADKVSPGMLAEEAFYWYWYAQQRDFTDVVATDTKRKLVKKLQFLDLVQKAAESTFPCDEDVEQQIEATIKGTRARVAAACKAPAELNGISKLHLELHYSHATLKHSYINVRFFEDNTIDQTARRQSSWCHEWHKELQALSQLYQRDLAMNPTRGDSWQSLGQCFIRMLDNMLNVLVIGNGDAAPQEDGPSSVSSGAVAEYCERARNCFERALELNPTSHVPHDMLGFLAFVQIRHGVLREENITEAARRFSRADVLAQQNELNEWICCRCLNWPQEFERARTFAPIGRKAGKQASNKCVDCRYGWIDRYPFMQGKLEELQGKPPKAWLPLYWEAVSRHRETCDESDNVELIYRLHASRLKAAFKLSTEDSQSWRMLLQENLSRDAPTQGSCLHGPRTTDTVATTNGNDDFVAQRKRVIDSAVSVLLGLLRRNSPEGMKWFYKTRYSVASARLKQNDAGGAVELLGLLFDTEKERARHFWKMHTYKYTDFGDFPFVTERNYDSWRMRCFYLYIYALTVAGDKNNQLLKLERALKRGNDKRVLNQRWTDEARICALAARYVVLVERSEATLDQDDRSAVVDAVEWLCSNAGTRDPRRAQPGGEQQLRAEFERGANWLGSIYELYCLIIQEKNATRFPVNPNSDLLPAGHPPLKSLSAKTQFLSYLRQRGVNPDEFSERVVMGLLQRMFCRFAARQPGRASVKAAYSEAGILAYCEKLLR